MAREGLHPVIARDRPGKRYCAAGSVRSGSAVWGTKSQQGIRFAVSKGVCPLRGDQKRRGRRLGGEPGVPGFHCAVSLPLYRPGWGGRRVQRRFSGGDFKGKRSGNRWQDGSRMRSFRNPDHWGCRGVSGSKADRDGLIWAGGYLPLKSKGGMPNGYG